VDRLHRHDQSVGPRGTFDGCDVVCDDHVDALATQQRDQGVGAFGRC
jgi:hypothetical protein